MINLSHRRGAVPATLILLVALVSGCANTGYHAQVASTVSASKAGNVDIALTDLEQKNSESSKDLLYFLEKGELLRMKGNYPESRDSWMQADVKVREWEEATRITAEKTLGDIGSFLINDTTRRYDGRDYEKVLLNMRLALNHLAIGNWDAARVEIKKMHEREAVIAEFRGKELEAAKKAAEEKGLKATSFKELNGYPVETLDAPEVRALKNAYESAVANYLAGFIYESMGESSLAAAGYRKAIEMRNGDKLLDDSLKGLDKRISQSRTRKSMVDTLILVESGNAPAITSRTLPIPLPIPNKRGMGLVMTPISWPVVEPADLSTLTDRILVDDKAQPLTLLTNVDHMARRSLSDEMPGIITRSSIRAIAKGTAQKLLQDNSSNLGMFGAVINLAANVAAVVSEKADERTWRTLPGFYSINRTLLAPGNHKVGVMTPVGPVSREVQVSGSYAIIVVRTTGNALYLAQSSNGSLADVSDADTPTSPIDSKSDKSRSGKKKLPQLSKTKKESTT